MPQTERTLGPVLEPSLLLGLTGGPGRVQGDLDGRARRSSQVSRCSSSAGDDTVPQL